MQDVSDKLLQQFVACIERQFAEPEAETAPDAGAAAPAAGRRCRDRRRVDGIDRGPPLRTRLHGIRWAAGRRHPPPRPAAPRPLRPAPAPAADDSIDLGATVLPVLVKNYAPYAVAGLARPGARLADRPPQLLSRSVALFADVGAEPAAGGDLHLTHSRRDDSGQRWAAPSRAWISLAIRRLSES